MAGIRLLSKLLLAAFLTACTTMKPHVDHIMLGASDLDRGVQELESLTGVRATYGGEHPNLGTHNALLSLGPNTYIEVIAPRAGATLDPDLAQLATLDRLTPVGWAVAMGDVSAFRARLAEHGIKTTEPRAGSRKKPSGDVLRWELVDIESASTENAPFFIHWLDPAQHPAKSAPGGCSLGSIEFDDPKADELMKIDRALGFDFPVRSAQKAAMRVTLRCGGRVIALPR